MQIHVLYPLYAFHPRRSAQEFAELSDLGVTSIYLNPVEGDLERFSKDWVRTIHLAAQHGLSVRVMWAAFGNVFASPWGASSRFAALHPDTWVVDAEGASDSVCCVNQQSFRDWFFAETDTYLRTLDLAGVEFDEPSAASPCYCAVCRSLCSDGDFPALRQRSVASFLNDASARHRSAKPDIETAVVLMPHEQRDRAILEQLHGPDVIGTDPYWALMKNSLDWLREECAHLKCAAARAGRRSQLWVQNFHIAKSQEGELARAFDIMLCARPDQLCCFYYWRQNDDPDAVWGITRKALLKAAGT